MVSVSPAFGHRTSQAGAELEQMGRAGSPVVMSMACRSKLSQGIFDSAWPAGNRGARDTAVVTTWWRWSEHLPSLHEKELWRWSVREAVWQDTVWRKTLRGIYPMDADAIMRPAEPHMSIDVARSAGDSTMDLPRRSCLGKTDIRALPKGWGAGEHEAPSGEDEKDGTSWIGLEGISLPWVRSHAQILGTTYRRGADGAGAETREAVAVKALRGCQSLLRGGMGTTR